MSDRARPGLGRPELPILAFAALLAGARAGALPAPKELHKSEGKYIIPLEFKLAVTPAAKEKLWILAERLEGTAISLGLTTIEGSELEVISAGDLDRGARALDVPPRAEGYLLDVSEKGLLVMARDELGIQWGLLKLCELLDLRAKTVPALLMRDWPDMKWRGVHLFMPPQKEFEDLRRFVDQVLLPYRFNTIVLEINYGFAFTSHPEVSEPGSPDAESVRGLGSFLARRGFRVVPEFNCLGHQSWGKKSAGLLAAHPEFDETPDLRADDPRLHSRSWCPRHPGLAPFLFDLWSEIVRAFDSRYFHIGLDEVFLLAEKTCPRCGGSAPWEVFAAAVAQYHAFFRGMENTVLMWGDRLLDANELDYGNFEASQTGTDKAIAFLPRDIVICDWHYGTGPEYPSLKHFQDQGFRVLACPWRDPKNVQNFWQYAQSVRTDRFLGFLATTWVEFDDLNAALFSGGGSEKARGAAECLRLVGTLCWDGKARKQDT